MNRFETLTFDSDFVSPSGGAGVTTLFVFACGYESRSLYLLNQIAKQGALEECVPLALCFSKYKEEGSRPANDRRLAALSVAATEIQDYSADTVLRLVGEKIDALTKSGNSVRVVVDYSSMPRRWYCNLVPFLRARSDIRQCEFWYVQGKYGPEEYPCVGYGDFQVFSGQARVTRTKEVHVFGLGFDSTRTYGVWNFLDPQFTCCLIAESDRNQRFVERVLASNSEILQAANLVQRVRLDDFPMLLSQVTDIARKCVNIGDVCLVADGPKPLVLAMSLAPILFGHPGVTSWHVGHVKPADYKPLDIPPSAIVYGFRMTGGTADSHGSEHKENSVGSADHV